MSDPPGRKRSDPTLVLDLAKALSPAAREAFELHARLEQDGIETQVACPTCQHCPECGGTHLVTPERRAELLAAEAGRSGKHKKADP